MSLKFPPTFTKCMNSPRIFRKIIFNIYLFHARLLMILTFVSVCYLSTELSLFKNRQLPKFNHAQFSCHLLTFCHVASKHNFVEFFSKFKIEIIYLRIFYFLSIDYHFLPHRNSLFKLIEIVLISIQKKEIRKQQQRQTPSIPYGWRRIRCLENVDGNGMEYVCLGCRGHKN